MSTQIKPEIEHLTENVRDVAGWFVRYEAVGQMCRWVKNETEDARLTFLSLYLAGDPATSFKQMDADVKRDYESVKRSLIARYGERPRDSYGKFVNSKYLPHSSIEGFIDYLREKLDNSAELSAVLKDRLVLFQFLLSIPQEKCDMLLMTCSDEESLSLEELIKKARTMAYFRPSIDPVTIATGVLTKKKVASDPKSVRCYNCNKYGHTSRECDRPRKPRSKNATAGTSPERSPRKGR